MAKNFLQNISVQFISLVRKGANKKTIIYKSSEWKENDEQNVVFECSIAKTDEEKQIVYGVVYSPNETDTQGDYTTAEEIEKAAHDFLLNARQYNVDKNHSFQKEEATIVESYVSKTDESQIIPGAVKGSWVVAIKINDNELWQEVKKGEITGLSMAGTATKIKKSDDSSLSFYATASSVEKLLQKIKSTFENILKSSSDINVDKTKQIQDSLSSAQENLTKAKDKEDPQTLKQASENIKKASEIIQKIQINKRSLPLETQQPIENDFSDILKDSSVVSFEKASFSATDVAVGKPLFLHPLVHIIFIFRNY